MRKIFDLNDRRDPIARLEALSAFVWSQIPQSSIDEVRGIVADRSRDATVDSSGSNVIPFRRKSPTKTPKPPVE